VPGRPLLIVAGLLAFVLTGCSSEVELPEPGGSTGPMCNSVLQDAPQRVDNAEARETASGAGRAWGDPAIILQCGVPKPDALKPTSRCAMVNGVGWFSKKTEDAYVFTTIGRETFVRVTVPREYEPTADALVDLAKTIKNNVPVVRECV